MHELSIAMSLVDMAAAAAREAGAERVEAVNIRVGALSGVVADALTLGFTIAAGGTIVEGARLDITALPVVIYCPACDAEAEVAVSSLRCPRCRTPSRHVRQGRELELAGLEIAGPQRGVPA